MLIMMESSFERNCSFSYTCFCGTVMEVHEQYKPINMKKLITVLSLGAFALGFSQSASYSDYQRSITDVNWETVTATYY